MKFDASDLLILTGALLVAGGLWLIYQPLALIGFGAGLFFLGVRAAR